MKLFILSHSHEMGGAELALFDMLEYLQAQGLVFDPFFVVPADGDFVRRLEQKQWQYKIIDYGPWIWGGIPHHPEDILRERMRNMHAVRTIQSLMKQHGANIAFSNTIVCPWAALAAGLEGIPHVWYVHEYGDDDHGLKFELGRLKTLQDIDALSDLVIANSRAIAERLATGIDIGKLTTAYIPYDVEAVLQRAQEAAVSPFKDPKALKLIFVGRITESKGQLEAVNALARLHQNKLPVELCLVGKVQDEDYYRDITTVIKQNGLSNFVHVLDHVVNPYPLIQAADAGVVASRLEAYGRVTFEYMLMGKPVIGSASGGTLEMIDDGLSGYLYEPGDTDELAKKTAHYIADPSLLQKHGQQARQKAEDMLNGENGPHKLLQLLRTVAAKDTPPRLPHFIGELFDLPVVIKAHYGRRIPGPRRLPIRVAKKLYHSSPPGVRRAAKPLVTKLKQARKRRAKKH